MPYTMFFNYFPEIAKEETRNIITFSDSDYDLPPAEYSFLEMFCDDPCCDCRRVFFTVMSSASKEPEAVVAWGWESTGYYKKWMRDDDPHIIADLKGPILNPWSPQSENAPAILKLVKGVLLRDIDFVERIKRHYAMFRKKVDEENPGTEYDRELNNLEPVNSEKIGRNEPCPCGSGKKYKKCCGAN